LRRLVTELKTYLLIPLLEVVFGLALFVVLLVRGRRQAARRPFSLFLVLLTLWGVFTFMVRFGAGAALLWERLVLASTMGASLLFYWFAVSFTGTRPKKNYLYPLLAACMAMMALIPTRLLVADIRSMWYGKALAAGPLLFLFVLCACAAVVQSAIILVQHSRQTRIADERVRDYYIIAGVIAMLVGAASDYLAFSGTGMYPLGDIGNILLCIFATAAMLKYKLLEMRALFREGVTLLLTISLIFGVFGSFVYLLSYIVGSFMNPVSISLTMVMIFIAALITPPVFTRLQHNVDRWFLGERYGHIQTLKRFTRETRAELGLEQLSYTLVNAVANGMQSLGVYLLLPSPATGTYVTYAYSGQKSRRRLHFPANSPLVVTMKQLDSFIDTLEMDVNPWFVSLLPDERQILESNGIELLVPMKNNGHLVGILLLGAKATRETYSSEERRLLRMVSTDAAARIDNASLYENIKREYSEMEKAMDGVVHALSLVVESRDPYTAGHQRRVAGLARSIASKMGLSAWQATGIYIAGLVHDVGKVAVPTDILNKPGKISQYEFSILKAHVQVGYEILQKIDFPWPVTTAILQHHERLDGSGYPAGISGEEIILEARILGVADVVEAMSSHRPYRPSLGLGNALEEITTNRGVLYDPKVVDACLNLLEKDRAAFDQIMAVAANRKYSLAAVTQDNS
jgi:HD-GYP domain-containing protein (c-di-GMP phosphodiesterase class II)